MKRRVLTRIAAALVIASLVSPIRSGADPAERTSTLDDREAVNLTIYNSELALVHDRRKIGIDRGENRIAWRDVSAKMDATSAILTDVTTPGSVRVVEQNFNFDLLGPSAVLAKYVGRDVTVVHDRSVLGRPIRETARVLADNGGIVLQYRDRIETAIDGHIEFPSIPSDLRDRPTLVLDLASDDAATPDLDLTYLTGGLSWSADYVGVVSPDESHVDLHGLVTLSNTSGTTFRDAHLQLVAGNVNVVRPAFVRVVTRSAMSSFQPEPAPQFNQENFFEYHLYTLQRTTSIANNQTKQVSLLDAHGVPIRKTLELRGDGAYYYSSNGDLGNKLKVGVYETFANKGGDLGIALPGGIVRLYKNDGSGTSQFLGSDTIDHTPKNEDVRLHVGDSFDVTASKKQTDFHLVGTCTNASSYEIVVKNAKTEPQSVSVIEQIPGDWTISKESAHHEKSSSSTAAWRLDVPAGGSAALDYTAVVKYCA